MGLHDYSDHIHKLPPSPAARLKFITLALSCESIHFCRWISQSESQLLDIFLQNVPFPSDLYKKINKFLGVRIGWITDGVGNYSAQGIRMLYMAKVLSKKISDIAREIEVSSSALSMALSGQNTLSKKIAQRCKHTYSINPDWLLNGSPPYMLPSQNHPSQCKIMLQGYVWDFYDTPDLRALPDKVPPEQYFCLIPFLDPRYSYVALRLLSQKFEPLGFFYNDILIVRKQDHASHGQLIVYQEVKRKFFFAKQFSIHYQNKTSAVSNDVHYPSIYSLEPNSLYNLLGVVVMSVHVVL